MSVAQLDFFHQPEPEAVGKFTPRPYQTACMDANAESWRSHRSVIDVMATGVGKAVVAAMECERRGGGLIAVHRDTLVRQAHRKLTEVTGRYVGMEKADEYSEGSAYVCASVQTLRGKRLEDFKARHPKLSFIVADEAHNCVTKSWGAILEAFPEAQVLGMTATPDRLDGKGLRSVFDTAAYAYPIVQATEEGWLTEGTWLPIDMSGVSLDAVGIKGHDIDQSALDIAVCQQAAEIAKAVVKHAHGQRSLIFTPGVRTAEAAAATLNQLVPGCAKAIHGGMPDKERDAIEAGHQAGEFPYLLNCQIYLEGYDDPKILNVFDFAKTLSRMRWAQKYGRLTRLWPHGIDHLPTVQERLDAICHSPKPTARFFDAQYGTHHHNLAGPLDLLGNDYSPEVRKVAQGILDTQNVAPGAEQELPGIGPGPLTVHGALEEAKNRVDEEKHRLEALAILAAKAQGEVEVLRAREAAELYGRAPRDPCELLHIRDPDTSPWGRKLVGPATEGQLKFLAWKGVPCAPDMSKTRASVLITELKKREGKGLASFAQVEALAKMGVHCHKGMTQAWALKLIQEMDRRARLVATKTTRKVGFNGYDQSQHLDDDY